MKEGERRREEKEERERKKTTFVYTVCLIPTGKWNGISLMPLNGNSFMRVYQDNWRQNQTRPQK